MNRENMAESEANGYRYILSAKIKNEIRMIRKWIPAQPKADKWMEEYDKGEERRLFVGNKNHARKETRNKENGISRQEKTYWRDILCKDHINKSGHNKFLKMECDITVSIDYQKLEADVRWTGWKNTSPIPISTPARCMVCHLPQPWQVERVFRISKLKIETRPISSPSTGKRLRMHLLRGVKRLQELERLLKLSSRTWTWISG